MPGAQTVPLSSGFEVRSSNRHQSWTWVVPAEHSFGSGRIVGFPLCFASGKCRLSSLQVRQNCKPRRLLIVSTS